MKITSKGLLPANHNASCMYVMWLTEICGPLSVRTGDSDRESVFGTVEKLSCKHNTQALFAWLICFFPKVFKEIKQYVKNPTTLTMVPLVIRKERQLLMCKTVSNNSWVCPGEFRSNVCMLIAIFKNLFIKNFQKNTWKGESTMF